jgi:hypothetical protein
VVFPKSQNPLDWITQWWNITLGKKVDSSVDNWLLGPIGDIGETAESFITKVAKEEGLSIQRNQTGSGLLDSFRSFDLEINPKIDAFYTRTSNFDFEVRGEWMPIFSVLGYLVSWLFSHRIQQLDLPRSSKEEEFGIRSQIIRLVNHDGETVYRIWYRCIQSTNKVIFYGIYTHCLLPSGELCFKIVFPLPQGSATVILRPRGDSAGNLDLLSSGKRYGDPGFYFLVKDRCGCLWKHYLPSVRQTIRVFEDEKGELRAAHSIRLWKLRVYDLHYRIIEKLVM